ncbi:hypothetical protein GZH53_13890 [Flavihumibacter sp. R14]|nr:hypothetical protein [Flavihumibacter soli]
MEESFEIEFEGITYLIHSIDSYNFIFQLEFPNGELVCMRRIHFFECNEIHPDTHLPVSSNRNELLTRLGEIIFNHFVKLYVYLEKEEWAESWVNGGSIPIYLNVKYWSDERDGKLTPDELRQKLITGGPSEVLEYFIDLDRYTQIIGNGNIFEIGGKTYQIDFNQRFEEALVLCMATELSQEVADSLTTDGKKKETCVQIMKIHDLTKLICETLGRDCLTGDCQYTDGPNRNHFLKSTRDKNQKEFRLVWRLKPDESEQYKDGVWIDIPSGIAKRVDYTRGL